MLPLSTTSETNEFTTGGALGAILWYDHLFEAGVSLFVTGLRNSVLNDAERRRRLHCSIMMTGHSHLESRSVDKNAMCGDSVKRCECRCELAHNGALP